MLANRVRELTLTTGTGDITLAGALSGHVRFSDAFTVGDSVTYVIEDGDNYEIGTGTLQAADTLARTQVMETLVDGAYTGEGAAAINLSGNARIFCAATADFLLSPTKDADLIREVTPDAGVTVDGVHMKDGVLSAASVAAASVAADTLAAGGATFSGDAVFEGQVTFNGGTVQVNSNEVNIGDSIIMLNADLAGAPTLDGGITINRGTSAGKSILWKEGADRWEIDDTLNILGNISAMGVAIGGGSQGDLFEVYGAGARRFSVREDGVISWNPDATGGMLSWDADEVRILANANTKKMLLRAGASTSIALDDLSNTIAISGNTSVSGAVVVTGGSFAGGASSGAAQDFSMRLNGWNGTAAVQNSIVGLGTVGGGLRFDVDGIQTQMLLEIGRATFAGTVAALGRNVVSGDNSNNAALFTGEANRSFSGATIAGLGGSWDGATVGRINILSGADTVNKDDGAVEVLVASGGVLSQVVLFGNDKLTTLGGRLSVSNPILMTESPGSAGAGNRYISGGGNATDWYTNAPTGGSHKWAVNEVQVLKANAGGAYVTGIASVAGAIITNTELSADTLSPTSTKLKVEPSFGFTVRPRTTTGGWARGLVPVADSTGTRLGGSGYLGDNETLTSYHIGFGPNWWGADSKFSILQSGDAAFTGTLTIDPGSEALKLKPGTVDHTYMAFYARSASPNTRSGYIGYDGAGTNNMVFVNALAGKQRFHNNGVTWLTASSAGDATFAGAVTVANTSPELFLNDADQGAGSQVRVSGANGNLFLNVDELNNGGNYFSVIKRGVTAFSIDSTDAATFGGELHIGTTAANASSRVIFGKTTATAESFLPRIQHGSLDATANDLFVGATSSGGAVRFFIGATASVDGDFGTGSNSEVLTLKVDKSATFAGNVDLQNNNIKGVTAVYQGLGSASIALSGGSTASTGANAIFFSEGHGSVPYDMVFRSNTVERLRWANASNCWDWKGHKLTNIGDIDINGMVNLGSPTELTIAAGAITVTKSFHAIDTEADAAGDTLSTINGGSEGDEITLVQADSTRDVTIDNAGNIRLSGGSFTFATTDDTITFINRAGSWCEKCRSQNI